MNKEQYIFITATIVIVETNDIVLLNVLNAGGVCPYYWSCSAELHFSLLSTQSHEKSVLNETVVWFSTRSIMHVYTIRIILVVVYPLML